LAFLAQTVGLGLRWYIAGHAPWSNGYESMIYVGWGAMLAGFIFMRKAPIVISVAALLTAVILLTAHMSWLNPEITNLVPVLKSYWLTFHVATITASYSFLALGCLIGFLNLLIIIFRNKSNVERVNLILKELTLIIELSLSIGLILLVIGNFLGGIWANESWGRYWGWDPKETWSLVTIIVYSFILHMRLIPGLRSTFSFNFLAMFGFASVLMTYFGVNYYLSGLHSYASGDPVPVPTFVYYTVGILILVSIPAYFNERKFESKSENFIT
jgi:cytochrome c-type biogenesis protein CcsB